MAKQNHLSSFNNFSYYIVALISTIYITGTAGEKLLVPLVSESLGASPSQIGLIVAFYSFFPLLLVILIGRWVDRIGSKKPIIFSTLLGSLILFLPFFMNNLIGVYLLQIAVGLAQTTFAVAAQNYMGNTGDETKRERNIAIFSIAVSIGSFIGPILAGSLSDWLDYGTAFAILGGISLFSTLLAFFLLENIDVNKTVIQSTRNKKEIKQDTNKKSSTFGLLKISNLRKAFLISALIMLGKDVYVTYFPLLGLEIGLSNQVIGLIVSSNAAAGIIIRFIMPVLVEKLGRNKVVIASIIFSGGMFLVIPILHLSAILMIISFLLGLGLGIGQPLSITTTILSLPKNRVGEGLGLRISVNRLTQVLGPITFGALADFFGYSAVFWIVGSIVILGSFKTSLKETEALHTEI